MLVIGLMPAIQAAAPSQALAAGSAIAVADLTATEEPAQQGGVYQIATAGNFAWLYQQTNGSATFTGSVKLCSDFDLSGCSDFDGFSHTSATAFAGTFDGGNHAINLAIETTADTATDCHSLFGFVAGGTIQNLTVTGSVSNATYAAGIVSYMTSGTLKNCHNEAAVTGTETKAYVGGIVAYQANGTVESCTNSGAITSKGLSAGGIAARTEAGTVTKCSNSGAVYSIASSVAGIVGYAYAKTAAISISECFNAGAIERLGTNVNLTSGVGGIAGYFYAYSYTAAIADCYNVGAIKANGPAAGIAGNIAGKSATTKKATISNCYNAGAVTCNCPSGTTSNKTYMGYICGSASSTSTNLTYYSVTNCWYNGTSFDAYGSKTNATVAAKYPCDTFSAATEGWASALIGELGSAFKADGTGDSSINGGYPILEWQETDTSKTVTSVAMTSNPTKTSYIETQKFDATGMVLTATWSDGSTTEVTDYLVNPSDGLSADCASVTISGTVGDKDYNFSVPVTVTANEVTALEVTTAPTKKVYASDENEVDAAGMVVEATYAADPATPLAITDYSATVNRAAGAIDVSYTYNGKTITATTPVTALDTPTPQLDGNYYQLTCANDLVWYADKANSTTNWQRAAMCNDIDATGMDFQIAVDDGKTHNVMFDGNGHTLTLSTSKAPFGRLIASNSVSNLTVEGTVGGDSATNVAGFAEILGGGTITNCVNKATVAGAGYVAGIAAQFTYGTISGCSNEADVSSSGTAVGGIVAYQTCGTISDCINSGAVDMTAGTTYRYVGGIVGGIVAGSLNSTPKVTGCANMGAVTKAGTTGTAAFCGTGGVVGYAYASNTNVSVSDCYNAAIVTAPYCVGGIAGCVRGTASTGVTVSNSYNAGAVVETSSASVGCYAGSVLGFGYDTYFTVANCYYLENTATNAEGTSSKAGTFAATAKAADKLKAADMPASLGSAWTTDTGATKINSGYPILTWQYVEPIKVDIAECTIAAIDDQIYTGSAIMPALTIANPDGEELVLGTDYAVEYSNNVATGTATVTVTGCGDDYEGTATATFVIKCVFTKGDVNNNGRINTVDAQIALDMANGKYGADYVTLLSQLKTSGTIWDFATATAAADYNEDSVVDATDARAIQSTVFA